MKTAKVIFMSPEEVRDDLVNHYVRKFTDPEVIKHLMESDNQDFHLPNVKKWTMEEVLQKADEEKIYDVFDERRKRGLFAIGFLDVTNSKMGFLWVNPDQSVLEEATTAPASTDRKTTK